MPNVVIPYAMMRGIFNRGARLPITRGIGLNYGVPTSTRNVYRSRAGNLLTSNRRRRGNGKRGGGLEINKSEGGFKSVAARTYIRPISVNIYGRLIYEWDESLSGFKPKFTLQREYFSGSTEKINVDNELNHAQEFLDWRKASLQYMVKSVSMSIDYYRVPKAGERVPKLFLWTNTDRVTVINPQYEPNVMVLDMSSLGVKNYNTRVSRATTTPDQVGWQLSSDDWLGKWEIHISAQDLAQLDRTNFETQYTLGTFKVSILVLFRLQDSIIGLNRSLENAKIPEEVKDDSKKVSTEEEVLKLAQKVEDVKIGEKSDTPNLDQKTLNFKVPTFVRKIGIPISEGQVVELQNLKDVTHLVFPKHE
jgi:hypothetical protein